MNVKVNNNIKMITLIFIDCECEYDDHIILFFETLKNHVEDFKCETKIDLRGIKIRKEEFDNILNMYEDAAKTDRKTKIRHKKRQIQIEDYLGSFMRDYSGRFFVIHCVTHGLLDLLKYAHDNGGVMWTECVCELSAECGQLECLKYAHEHGCPWDIQTIISAAQNGHIECLKYAHEHGCFAENEPKYYYRDLDELSDWIINGKQLTDECAKYLNEHDDMMRRLF